MLVINFIKEVYLWTMTIIYDMQMKSGCNGMHLDGSITSTVRTFYGTAHETCRFVDRYP
jgi:hypothetical protein